MTKEQRAGGLTPVGYWKGDDYPGDELLPVPQALVDRSWERRERTRVATYLRRGRSVRTWRGYSHCRFRCRTPDWLMGDKDLTDGVYIWPEGFAHYLEKHRVKPPESFLAHVREQLREHPELGEPVKGLRGQVWRLWKWATSDRPKSADETDG